MTDIKKIQEYIYQKKYQKAEKELKKLIKKEHYDQKLLILLAHVYSEQNNYYLALSVINKILIKDSSNANAHLACGNVYIRKQDLLSALIQYKKAIEINPRLFDAWLNIGNVLALQREWKDALQAYKEAEKLEPRNNNLLYNKALTLNHLKDYEQALILFDKVIQISPSFGDAWFNKGWTLYNLGKLNDALSCYDHALLINPNNPLTWSNRGVAMLDLKRYEEAEESFKKSIEIDTVFKNSHKNLYQTQLYLKKFFIGWKNYEKRWNETNKLHTSNPEWQGEPSAKILFIWGEQGIGDQILYASMFKELVNYPQKKIISINRKLIPIFKRSFPDFEFIDKETLLPESYYQEQLPLGDLGKYFRTSSESFDAVRFPYLHNDQLKTQNIINQFKKSSNLKCGISWRSANTEVGEYKSINLAELKPLLSLEGLDFINLQYGDVDNEIQNIENSSNIKIQKMPDIDLYDDIDSTASLIMACDVIITVSNSVAHLAGALGKKSYLLLSTGRGKFWYWHTKEANDKSLWYPTITIIEQDELDNWQGAIQKLVKLIKSE